MTVSGVVAIVGVYTINALRIEAFEARQLGQYQLGRRLGGGGMGEVYLAEHQLMKRPCAIKLIRPEKAGDPRTLARFEREVRASAKLSHWNNIDIFDYGRAADGTFYYVMEYLPGMSLADLVERHGPVPPARVVFLLRQTCEALAEAHAMGLIHRDIKPANIFAAERGRIYDVAKLLDFGMVKPMDGPDEADLTHDGSITGSPLYMSPEQVTGDHEPDARTDIYSLGVVAYYLLSGRHPFEAVQPIKIMVAHAHQNPVPLSQLAPNVPADLEAIVMRCLAKNPADRFSSARDLAKALDSCEVASDWSHAHAAAWWAEIGNATDATGQIS
jgi:eukaryotic-like serine/threonine-protein kinase